MKIEDIFVKSIHRNIEGVIKADSDEEAIIRQEVEEYVVTRELNSKFDLFFRFYAQTIDSQTQENGVWISGFFGSGKSHLLKMLSYILSNKPLGDVPIAKIFESKIDKSDFELAANITKALTVPAETILFNIDQKAENLGALSQEDKLLAVFAKVFYEKLGLYGKSAHIAGFELGLYEEGLYEKFVKTFETISGKQWIKARETLALHKGHTAEALSSVKGVSLEDAKEYIGSLKEDFSLSIETFAQQVNGYISQKPKNFRLIFCVDEIGQYIGDNTRLMLNLQTIVESLATKTSAKAWVIVTSQEDIDKIIERSTSQSNDFSKIQGRFKVKLNLTSKDAHEVIEKRLLDKKDEAAMILNDLYAKYSNTLRSIIHFEGREYKQWKNASEFIRTYPFVPYQFTLFQECIRELSRHGAFQGLHQSVGERSMLGAFQDVLKGIDKRDLSGLVSFDMFFEALRHTIKGETQASINQAENNLANPFAIKVLKVLFLVKYIKFSATLDNLATLLVSSFDENVSTLKKELKEALDMLERQVYIQKIGDVYEYLSDKEKDIENEIKSMQLLESDLNGELKKLLIDDVLGGLKKVRYEKNRYDYPIEIKMDGTKISSGEASVVVNFITPQRAYEYNDTQLSALSMGTREIVINLGAQKDFDRALELYVKTEKYIPQKHSNALAENEKNILHTKASQNRERRKALSAALSGMLENANIYFNGSELSISAKNGAERVKEAVNEAIGSLFPMLGVLGDRIYTEADIKTFLTASCDLDYGDESLCEAEKELLGILQRAKAQHKNHTIGDLLDMLTDKPYGWYPHAIACIVAMLISKGRVELKQNSNTLDKSGSLRALTNNREYASTYAFVTKSIGDESLKKAQKAVSEIFAINVSSLGAKELYELAQKECMKLTNELEGFGREYKHGFLEALDAPLAKLKEFGSLRYDDFFDKSTLLKDELLDMLEDTISPVREFMNGSQHKIYIEIKSWLEKNRENAEALSKQNLSKLEELINDKRPYLGGKVTAAKSAFEELKGELNRHLDTARDRVNAIVNQKIEELSARADFGVLGQADKHLVLKSFLDIGARLKDTNQLDTLHKWSSAEFLADIYSKALDKIDELSPKPQETQPVKKNRIKLSECAPSGFGSIKTKEDVQKYIDTLQKAMLEAVEKDIEILL